VPLEHAAQHLHRQQPRVAVGHAPEVLDLDRVNRGALGDRASDAAEVARQR
jgi:hypothetical protein